MLEIDPNRNPGPAKFLGCLGLLIMIGICAWFVGYGGSGADLEKAATISLGAMVAVGAVAIVLRALGLSG